MSAASRSTPARASWRRPSPEVCLSPEPLKIWCQVPELFSRSRRPPAQRNSRRVETLLGRLLIVAANVQLLVSGCAAAPSSNIAVTPSSAHLIQLRITHLIILPAISGDSADISIAVLKAPDIRSSCWSITPRRPQPTRRHDDRADAAAESSADRATRNSHEVAPVTGTR